MNNRYFIDTEFIEDGKTIELISIGIITDDDRTYYAVNSQLNKVHLLANPWLVEHVVPHLPLRKVHPDRPWSWDNTKEDFSDPAWKTRQEIRDDLLDFIKVTPVKPQFWGYYADYDWVAICQLFGRMIDLPNGWPMYCRDLKQLADTLGIDRFPQPKPDAEHNALADAQWNRDSFLFAQDAFMDVADSVVVLENLEKLLGL